MKPPFRIGDEVQIRQEYKFLYDSRYHAIKRVAKVWNYRGLNLWVLEFVLEGNNTCDSRWADHFELARPPTPFELDLRAYLAEEL